MMHVRNDVIRAALASVLLLAACSDEDDGADAATTDAARDASVRDSATSDAGRSDAGFVDAATTDGGPGDDCAATLTTTVSATAVEIMFGAARVVVPEGAFASEATLTLCRLTTPPANTLPVEHEIASDAYRVDLSVAPQMGIGLYLPRATTTATAARLYPAIGIDGVWELYEGCEVTEEGLLSYIGSGGTYTLVADTVIFGDRAGGSGSMTATLAGNRFDLVIDDTPFPGSWAYYSPNVDGRTVDIKGTAATSTNGFQQLRVVFALDALGNLQGDANVGWTSYENSMLETWDYVPGIHAPGAVTVTIDEVTGDHIVGSVEGRLFSQTSSTTISGVFTVDVEKWRWPPELSCPGGE